MPAMAIEKRDFSQVKEFPGSDGNGFDVVLRVAEIIEGLPGPIFAAALAAPALLAGWRHGSWLAALGLWLFSLIDWALLRTLPVAGRSFGPAKPPAAILALLRLPPALLPLPFALAAELAGTLFVFYGFWIEPLRLGVTHQVLRTPKLRAGQPLRLLHLGDLHAEIGLTKREEKLMELVRELAPDVILFSGDLINLSYLNDARAWEAAQTVLRQLHAPLGVYAVSGSPAVDRPPVVENVLAGMGNIRWLQDEIVTISHGGQRIDLVGITCTHKPFVDGPRLQSVLAASRAGGDTPLTILLYHTPDLAPEAAEAGIDLQLSGHTHGGQVRLPGYGALFAGSLYGKRFESGRMLVGRMVLYVTRGIGMEGKGAPRVRFLTPPEVILWEIDGVEDAPPKR